MLDESIMWEIGDLLIFGPIMAATWFLLVYNWPRVILYLYKRAILIQGFGEGPIPVNTLYTEPQEFFADPIHPPASASNLGFTGVNRDTLMTIGWLDLKKGPLVLHVPEMNSRYYSVQFTNPSNNEVIAYVGRRTTGTKAGDYLITEPNQKIQVPSGMKQISSPNNSVLVVGRVLVESDSDLPTAHKLTEQIRLTPLNREGAR
jgi:hypothetical protein